MLEKRAAWRAKPPGARHPRPRAQSSQISGSGGLLLARTVFANGCTGNIWRSEVDFSRWLARAVKTACVLAEVHRANLEQETWPAAIIPADL